MLNVDMFIGIDVGVNGGVATWTASQGLKVFHMPKTSLDKLNLFKLIKERAEHPLVFIEKVQQRPSDSYGGKQFGIVKMVEGYTQLKTIMETVGVPYVMVHPMSWQTYLHLRMKDNEEKTARKNRYKMAAGRYYPEVKPTLWNADAILLVEFGRRKKKFDEQWIVEQLPKVTQSKLL